MSESATPAEQRRLTASAIRTTAMVNGGAVVVAALYFGQELLVPLVLAGLLAFVLAPLARLLERVRVPHVAAVFLAVVVAFGIIGLLSMIVGQQISSLATHASEYQANIMAKWQKLVASNHFVAQIATPLDRSVGGQSTSTVALAERFARPILGPATTAAVVLVFTLVILLYSEDLRDRFVRLVGRHDLHRTIFAMNDAAHRLSRYFLSQLTINASFGLWIGAALFFMGLPGAILLGLVAMLMRFVPFVGIFIAVGPPLAIAVAVGPTWTLALMVLGLFVLSEVVVSQVVEPLLYGHSTGLSPVAVLVATSFWTLLWGFVGLLIATPLTVCLVVLGRHVPAMAFFDVLLGSGSPLLPSETFYQRALEGRSMALLSASREQIKETSRADYYGHVAMPALVLAQHDTTSDATDFDRVDLVHSQIEALLTALATGGVAAKDTAVWSAERSVLCLPARGEFDDLAAEMVTQALQESGVGAVSVPNTALSSAGTDQEIDFSQVKLLLLSVVEQGAVIATIRFFVKQMQVKAPEAAVVIGLWGASSGSALLAALREEGGEVHLIQSIGELVAHVRAISVQTEKELA